MASINELASIIANIAGVHVNKKHVPGRQGVRGRNSDNTRFKEVLRWEPQISLEEDLRRTYYGSTNRSKTRPWSTVSA